MTASRSGAAASPTTEASPAPALLVVDTQNTLVAIAHRASATVAAVAGLQARARAAGAPVEAVAHHNEIYRNLRFPGRRVRVLPAAEVDFGRGTPCGPGTPSPG